MKYDLLSVLLRIQYKYLLGLVRPELAIFANQTYRLAVSFRLYKVKDSCFNRICCFDE